MFSLISKLNSNKSFIVELTALRGGYTRLHFFLYFFYIFHKKFKVIGDPT